MANALRTAAARITFVFPRQDAFSTQLTGANMGTAETPSAAGRGWRSTLVRFYHMIEALETSLETSPLESLYDRVLQLEQEVSALKRNSLTDSVDRM